MLFFLILGIAIWTYNIALEQAVSEAEIIHQQCNENSVCPENPAGWEVDGKKIRKKVKGLWLAYSVSYYYKKESFNIRVYQGPDIGEVITGGVNLPFKVERYSEG